MYTAILLDDEEKGRSSLQKLLTDYCPDIKIVGIASSGEEALELILKLRPQILFLDIEIAQAASKYSTTFELLPKIPKYDFEVVFVTAYQHYALQAIRSHAVGYVLKPISIEDLVQCVSSVTERLESTNTTLRFEELVNQIQSSKPESHRIWIHSMKEVIPLNYNNIIRFEAQGKYTDIYCENDKRVTSSKNLGEFVEMLDQNRFIKVHRSHVVNTDKIEKFSKPDGGTVKTSDGKEIPVSKSGRERLFNIL